MKKLLLLLPILAMMTFSNLDAQLDTTRNQEFRASFIGLTSIPPMLDDRFNFYGRWTNLSLTYLRRYKNSNHFFKARLSGVTVDAPQIFNEEPIGAVLYTTINLALGFEKQYQYKHFGAFFGAGINGGFLDYQADYQFPDEPQVRDFTSLDKQMGIYGDLTLFTNVSDKLYFYATISFSTFYINRDVNDINVLDEYRGLNSQATIDGIGLAYKF